MLHALLALVAALSPPHVSARIATGLHPCGSAAGFGAVWVANDGSGTLARVSPRTNRVTRRVRVGRGACSVDAGAGFVWVTNYNTASVVRVNPSTFRKRSVRSDGPPSTCSCGMAMSGRAPGRTESSSRSTQRASVPSGDWMSGPIRPGCSGRSDAIWVGFGKGATAIARIDPATGRLTRVPVGAQAPSWFATGTADLWITAADDVLVHVDPSNGHVFGTMHVGRTLAQPAAAPDGTIRVPDKEIDTIYRVDPGSGRVVDSFAGGDGAFFALRAFGSMWVTSYAGADVWRFRP